MTNYSIGDFLVRIKNAALSKHKELVVPFSKLTLEVAKELQGEGFLAEVFQEGKKIRIILAFHKKVPVLRNLKLISRPGLRVYKSYLDLQKQKGNSVFILTTSKGVLSSREALKKGVGGEVLTEVW